MDYVEHIIHHPDKRKHETPLFFQHGSWHDAWCWHHWLDYFSEIGYEVHAINLPGRGGSSTNKGHINKYGLVDYLEILVDKIGGISPAPVVVGHSMGGYLLQKFIETYPLPGAVLLAPIPSVGSGGMVRRLIKQYPLPFLKGALTQNNYHWVSTPKLAQSLFLGPKPAIDTNEFHQHIVRESMPVGIQTMSPIKEEYVKITPVLVIAAENDALFTVDEQKITAQKYAAELIIAEQQGHDLMLEPDWQQVADMIDDWVINKLNLP